MNKKKSPIKLIFYFILSLISMELILRTTIIEKNTIYSVGISLFFSISIALILYMFSSFFNKTFNKVVSFTLLFIMSFIFASQFIYYKIFNVFYSIYSAKNASQAFEFWEEIALATKENFIWILLLFIPPFLLLLLGKEFFEFNKLSLKYKSLLISSIIITHLLGIGVLHTTNKGFNSSYDLYYNTSSSFLSMQKLGLITSMRLDFQRFITGWSPSLNIATTVEPSLKPGKGEKEEKKKEYNNLDIDFKELISKEEEDEEIKKMHQYFNSLSGTTKNKYTGKFKDYNLILITAEGFSHYAVNKEITPTLYKMAHEGYNFTNFYNPIWEVSTSDGEYVANAGLLPKSGVWSFPESGKNHMPFAMGNQLKPLGYTTKAYHNHTYTYYKRHISHPNMGYDYKGVGNGLEIKETWPSSDLEMMEKTVPEYVGQTPFHAYYMTVSGHLRYTFNGNMMAYKNKEVVKDLPLSEAGRAYMATQVELDRALEFLLNTLEEKGLAENTLIVMSADHYPYGLKDKEIDELAGKKVEKNFELYKSAFILYAKGMEPKTIEEPMSSLDIIPTISNLMGIEYDSRLLMGQDIFSNSDPLVIFLNRSFITDKGRYNALENTFIPNKGVSVKENYVNKISQIVNNKFYYSAKILERDYYGKVFKEKKNK